MKFHQSMPLFLLLVGVCACTPESDSNTAAESADPVLAAPASTAVVTDKVADVAAATAADQAVLAKYHWHLESATSSQGDRLNELFVRAEKPLQLNFYGSHVYISNTCNHMGGEFTIRDNKLSVSQLTSTMKACADEALMALDQKVAKVFAGDLDMRLDQAEPATQLTLVTTEGASLVFAGVPTAATRTGSEAETVFLQVAPISKPCANAEMPKTQCLEVRELHYNANGTKSGNPGPWHMLKQPIEGYQHQPGTHNVLRVKRYAVTKPAAGTASATYVLDLVVESGVAKP